MSDASLIVPLRQRETMITILHLHTVQVKSFFTIIFRQCPKEILSKNAHKARITASLELLLKLNKYCIMSGLYL